jgi:hypothetical protein
MLLDTGDFPTHQNIDDDGNAVMEEEEQRGFLCAWAGDYCLMTLFQCKTCHIIWNMLGKILDKTNQATWN